MESVVQSQTSKKYTFIAVDAGGYCTTALSSAGRLLAWGDNKEGQCSSIPSLGEGEVFIGVAAGLFHTAALTSTMRLLAWGCNGQGQCSPIPSLGEGEAFIGVAAGLVQTAALTSTGRLLAWGGNVEGQCSPIPSLVQGEAFIGVAVGTYHTAALTSTGRVLAWGSNSQGQCSPIPSLGEGEAFIGVAAGVYHTAALTSTGRLLAWGGNDDGQCSPIPSLGEGEAFIGVAAGGYHTAALTSTGRLLAWGRNDNAECSPIPSLGEGEAFIVIAAGVYHTAALTSTGRLLAWGSNIQGQCSPIPSLGEGEACFGVAAGHMVSGVLPHRIAKEVLRLSVAGKRCSLHLHEGVRLYKHQNFLAEPGMTKLHLAAVVGDVNACKLEMQGGALARRRNGNGRTAMDLAIEEGHTEVIAYLKQFSHISTMRGGSGNALEAALADNGYIQGIKWYTLPMDSAVGKLGIVHSLLAVTNGIRTYTIEKALLDGDGSTHERFKNGVFVSDWLEVSACFEVDSSYKSLNASDFSEEGKSMTMRSLHTLAVEMGPYDVGRCNCHHTALLLYNACADDLSKVTDMPNEGWTNLAGALGGIIELNWLHSSPAESTGLVTVQEETSLHVLTASQKALQTRSSKAGVLSQSVSNVVEASVAAGAAQVTVELSASAEPCSQVLEGGIEVMERASEAFELSQKVEKELGDLLGEDHVLPISDWIEALAEQMPLVKQVAGILRTVHAKHKGRADVQKKLAKLVDEIQLLQKIAETMENQEVQEVISQGLQQARRDLKSIVLTDQIFTPEACITTIDAVAQELQSKKATCSLMLAASGPSARSGGEPQRNQQCCCMVQ